VIEVVLSRQLECTGQQQIETADRVTRHVSPASFRQRHDVVEGTGDIGGGALRWSVVDHGHVPYQHRMAGDPTQRTMSTQTVQR
jgi:hypothetical protein